MAADAVHGTFAVLVKGGAELEDAQIALTDRVVLRAAPGHVVVKVLAAGVNISDVEKAKGLALNSPADGIVTGRDFAGVVVDGPEELLGVNVMGCGGSLGVSVDGSHAQFIAVPAESVVQIPSNMSFEDAAALAVPFVVAHDTIVTKCRTGSDDVVVVQGAFSPVGSAVLQMAKVRGATTVALILQNANAGTLAADHVVATKDLTPEQIVEQVLAVTKREAGVDVFVDTIGCAKLGILMLAKKGRLAIVSPPRLETSITLNLTETFNRQLAIFGVNSLQFTEASCAAILTKLAPLFETKELVPLQVNPTRFTLGEVRRALQEVARGVRFRVVILPWGMIEE